MSIIGRYIPVFSLILLTACGFQPVYKKTAENESNRLFLSNIQLTPIGGKLGQQLRMELEDRLPAPVAEPTLLVSLNLKKDKQPVGITLERRITRYNVLMKANLRIKDAATGKDLHSEPLESITSYNVIQDSDYATYIAERDATKRAVSDLAVMVEQRLIAFYQERYVQK